MLPYQVLPNRTIRAPGGSRFVARGITMFDYLLCSFEPRDDLRFRKILSPPWAGPAIGVSEPTYAARLFYKNEAYVREQIAKAWRQNVNMIRLAMEPAVQYATLSYVDPTDGQAYPSDVEMMDKIIEIANEHGMVVQLQMGHDACPTTVVTDFLPFLVTRYASNPMVWINPWNEPAGWDLPNASNPVTWYYKVQPCLSCLRSAGWKNPIVVDPPGYATRIDLIDSILTTDPTFAGDPNLILNVHYYPAPADTDFRSIAIWKGYFSNYLPKYCVIFGEIGVIANGIVYDPNLNAGVPSADLAAWVRIQGSIVDFLQWANQKISEGSASGIIGQGWAGNYVYGTVYDNNAMFYANGNSTTWGSIYVHHGLSPSYSADLAAGAILENIGNLPNGRRIGNSTFGTSPLQAVGKAGGFAALTLAFDSVNGAYAGFHSMVSGHSVGTIAGDGASGVLYLSSSDERLKTDIEPAPPGLAIEAFRKLRPVLGRMIASSSEDREFMFLAHHLQEAMPRAVVGKRGEVDENGTPRYQVADYARVVPLLAAVLGVILDRLDQATPGEK